MSRKRSGLRLAVTLAAWASGSVAVACTPDAPATRPNVLLVVVDTLRADRVGGPRAGGGASLTPFVDGLAARGATFRNAYTPTPWTSPAVATLFTSRYPLQHGVARYDSQLAPEEVTLAERLAAAGYACAGFSANLYVQERLGYAQGFAEWQTYLGDPDGEVKPRAGLLIDRAVAWLDARGRAGDDRPGFLYLQFLEPHSPYVPPASHRTGVAADAAPEDVERANETLHSFHFKALDDRAVALLRSLYDGEVSFFDAALAALFARLEPTGFLDGAIVVVTSDHGEEFREHESLLHGVTLYESAVRVPLVFVGPGVEPGRVVDEPVSTLDVPATLLDWLGLPREPHFEGRSLLPQLHGRVDEPRGEPRDILLELEHRGGDRDVRRHAWGLVRGRHKLLVDASGEARIYALDADPAERRPRDAASDADGRDMQAALERLRADLERRSGSGPAPAPIDDATRARLRALGYDAPAR